MDLKKYKIIVNYMFNIFLSFFDKMLQENSENTK